MKAIVKDSAEIMPGMRKFIGKEIEVVKMRGLDNTYMGEGWHWHVDWLDFDCGVKIFDLK